MSGSEAAFSEKRSASDDESNLRWWLAIDDKPEGPHTKSYIEMLLRSSRIRVTNLACLEGGDKWKPVCEWPDLADLAGAQESQIAPPPVPVPDVQPRRYAFLTRLTNPRLPWMANVICFYCIVVHPALTLLSSLFTFGESTASTLPYDSPAVWPAVMYDALVMVFDIGIAVALVIAGLHLRRLRRVGASTIKVLFVIGFAWGVIVLLTATLWWALAAVITPQFAAEEEFTGFGVILILFGLLFLLVLLAAFVFRIVAFVWLLRYESELPLDGRDT